MRGFALSDSLMALAIVSLLLVVMLSRGPALGRVESARDLRPSRPNPLDDRTVELALGSLIHPGRLLDDVQKMSALV